MENTGSLKKNTFADYIFVIVLLAIGWFFPVEACLLLLGAKGKEWFDCRTLHHDTHSLPVNVTK